MKKLLLLPLAIVAVLIPRVAYSQAASGANLEYQVKAAFLKLLDRPRVDADIKNESVKKLTDGFVLEHLTFASEKKADGTIERVPVLILKPEKAKGKFVYGRANAIRELDNFEEIRTAAAAIRDRGLGNLDAYLLQFEREAQARGAVVHQSGVTASPWHRSSRRRRRPQTVGKCGGDRQPDVSRTDDDNIGLADTTIGRHRHRDVQRSSRAST